MRGGEGRGGEGRFEGRWLDHCNLVCTTGTGEFFPVHGDGILINAKYKQSMDYSQWKTEP